MRDGMISSAKPVFAFLIFLCMLDLVWPSHAVSRNRTSTWQGGSIGGRDEMPAKPASHTRGEVKGQSERRSLLLPAKLQVK